MSGFRFAEKSGLPCAYVNVMRWIDTPAQATEDVELVAVGITRPGFVPANHLGHGGDAPLQHLPTIEESEE